jgi:hypothetical protein
MTIDEWMLSLAVSGRQRLLVGVAIGSAWLLVLRFSGVAFSPFTSYCIPIQPRFDRVDTTGGRP